MPRFVVEFRARFHKLGLTDQGTGGKVRVPHARRVKAPQASLGGPRRAGEPGTQFLLDLGPLLPGLDDESPSYRRSMAHVADGSGCPTPLREPVPRRRIHRPARSRCLSREPAFAFSSPVAQKHRPTWKIAEFLDSLAPLLLKSLRPRPFPPGELRSRDRGSGPLGGAIGGNAASRR